MKSDNPLAPEAETLARLSSAWGNEAWSPHIEFLQSVLDHAVLASGPIVECGAGLSTVILGVVCQVRGLHVTTIEEDPQWAETVRACLTRHGIDSVSVVEAPLRPYAEYDWYSLPSELLPERISLAICDGPSGRAPGARFGLVPVLRSRLGSGTVVLLDDAERPSEREFIPRWSALLGATPELVRPGREPSPAYEFAVWRLPGDSAEKHVSPEDSSSRADV